MFTAESLVSETVLATAHYRTNNEQVQVMSQNLDHVAAEDSWARSHLGWVANHVSMGEQLEPQADVTESFSLT